KTAFRIPYSYYKYLVMLFGLTNVLITFYHKPTIYRDPVGHRRLNEPPIKKGTKRG
ncbi:hypothetical protein MYCTH_52491, partial [Thermothelomyces thermophilus ATCC 42464]